MLLQCSNGHLMCASCLSHLLADGRLKDESTTCPNCRCEISKPMCIRNLAVEKAISEMPSDCSYCCKQVPRHQLQIHETEVCSERCVCDISAAHCSVLTCAELMLPRVWNNSIHVVILNCSNNLSCVTMVTLNSLAVLWLVLTFFTAASSSSSKVLLWQQDFWE